MFIFDGGGKSDADPDVAINIKDSLSAILLAVSILKLILSIDIIEEEPAVCRTRLKCMSPTSGKHDSGTTWHGIS